jgi:hypothetical protein
VYPKCLEGGRSISPDLSGSRAHPVAATTCSQRVATRITSVATTKRDLESDRFEGIEASEEGSTVYDDASDGCRKALRTQMVRQLHGSYIADTCAIDIYASNGCRKAPRTQRLGREGAGVSDECIHGRGSVDNTYSKAVATFHIAKL